MFTNERVEIDGSGRCPVKDLSLNDPYSVHFDQPAAESSVFLLLKLTAPWR
jgi:hypothetical protein